MLWFTLSDGNSIAIAPERVRYILPTEGGQTVICFSRDERFTVDQPPTEVAARIRGDADAEEPALPRAKGRRKTAG